MKTIADFKRKAIVGAKVKTSLFLLRDGKYIEIRRHEERTISRVQSNSFAISTWSAAENKLTDSWCEWPKKTQFVPVADNTAEIRYEGGKLVFTFC